MEAKIVVGTKSGKSYNLAVKDDLAAVFIGKRIGDVVNITPLGLKGYEVKITGGSDKCGFPMRKDLHKAGRGKSLMSTRTIGYKPRRAGLRERKTVVGDTIDDNISQINTIVVKEGKDSIAKLLGLEKAESKENSEETQKDSGVSREKQKEAEDATKSTEENKTRKEHAIKEVPTNEAPKSKDDKPRDKK